MERLSLLQSEVCVTGWGWHFSYVLYLDAAANGKMIPLGADFQWKSSLNLSKQQVFYYPNAPLWNCPFFPPSTEGTTALFLPR